MRRSIVFTCLLLAVPCVALAASIEKGSVELAERFEFAHSSYSYDGDATGSTTNLDLTTSIAYAVSPRVQIQGDVLYSHASSDPEYGEGSSGSALGFAGDVVVNFETTSNVIPFLAAGIGVITYSGDTYGSETSAILPQIGGGIRLMAGSSAAVNFSLAYRHLSNASGIAHVSSNAITMGVGLSLFL